MHLLDHPSCFLVTVILVAPGKRIPSVPLGPDCVEELLPEKQFNGTPRMELMLKIVLMRSSPFARGFGAAVGNLWGPGQLRPDNKATVQGANSRINKRWKSPNA